MHSLISLYDMFSKWFSTKYIGYVSWYSVCAQITWVKIWSGMRFKAACTNFIFLYLSQLSSIFWIHGCWQREKKSVIKYSSTDNMLLYNLTFILLLVGGPDMSHTHLIKPGTNEIHISVYFLSVLVEQNLAKEKHTSGQTGLNLNLEGILQHFWVPLH